MQVRVLEETDEPRYRALRLASIEETPAQASPELVRELSFFVRAETGVLANHVLEGTRAWGAFVGERLVGAVAATRGFDPNCLGTMHLWGLYVVPEVRGAGIGARLLQAALAWVRRQPAARRVIVYARCGDDHAMRLFGEAGFKVVVDETLHRTRLCAMRLELGRGAVDRHAAPAGERGTRGALRRSSQRANGGIG